MGVTRGDWGPMDYPAPIMCDLGLDKTEKYKLIKGDAFPQCGGHVQAR